MVYLFLVCYGRSKADQIHLVIPSFLQVSYSLAISRRVLTITTQDCNDRNPLVRALAIRTMSYIPIPVVTEALVEQLRHCLKDKDPYVRKTAAICVAKVYTADPRKAEKEGFVEMLRDMMLDTNATVVSNAVAALTEIGDRQDGVIFKLNVTIASKLITALGDSSEWAFFIFIADAQLYADTGFRWGQIYILDSLLRFVPEKHEEAEFMAERVIVQLQHANSAVVLTTIKVLLYLMNYMDDRRLMEYICRKMGPPLGTCPLLLYKIYKSHSSNSDITLIWSGSAVCRVTEYPAHHPKATICSQERR